jgi:glucokinase
MADQDRLRIGIEMSRTALTLAVLDANDNISKTAMSPIVDVEDSTQALVTLLEDLKHEYPDLERVGLAVPGLIEEQTHTVTYSASIPQHTAFDLASMVKTATGLYALVDNDANAAAYGEYRLGSGRGSRNLFYITLGEGVGGAFIINGALWRGAAGYAGEFGFVPINSEGTRLEDVASAASIVRRTRSRFHQDSTSSLNRLAEDAITLREIISAAENNDDFAQMMLGRTGIYVGTAVASVINLLNIEKIVVGGAIMQASSVVLNAIRERARELAFGPSFSSTEIVEGALGDAAAAIGIALMSDEPLH